MTKKDEKDIDQMLESEPERDPAGGNDFEDFFSDYFGGQDDFYVSVYKVTSGPDSKKMTKEYLEKWRGEIHDEDYIGYEYGGGKFVLYGKLPGKPIKTKVVNLGKIWDERKAERDREKRAAQAPAPAIAAGAMGAPSAPHYDPFASLKELIGIITPFLELKQKTPTDPMGMMKQFQEVFMGNFKNQVRELTTMKKDLLEKPKAKEEGDDLRNGIISFLKEAIHEFSPLLQRGGVMANAAAAAARHHPYADQLREDEGLFQEVYEALATDPAIGKDKVDACLSKIGFDTYDDDNGSAQGAAEKENAAAE